MMHAGGAEYAAARMHAWLGRRPDPVVWRAVCEARAIAPMIELLAGSTLAPIAGPLAHAPDLHALDRSAAAAWEGVVSQAANWVPSGIAPAVTWCAPLPLLPALAHLALGQAPLPWMAAHPALATLAAGVTAEGPSRTIDGPLAALVVNGARPGEPGAAWLAEWRRRLPPRMRAAAPLAQLAGLVESHLRRFGHAGAHESEPLRAQLERRLLRHFRRQPEDPSAVFAWLALAALDIRRLRGEFARRIALPLARPVP